MQSPLVHWVDRISGYEDMSGMCGEDIAYGVDYSTEMERVTCVSCLVSLTTRGREAATRRRRLERK